MISDRAIDSSRDGAGWSLKWPCAARRMSGSEDLAGNKIEGLIELDRTQTTSTPSNFRSPFWFEIDHAMT
jgi:hypothetical protein